MTTVLLIAILGAIAAIAVLIIYLIDRVNSIDKFARLVQADQSWSSSDPAAMGLFGDLHGKRLWDAVSGVPIEGWDKGAIDLIKQVDAIDQKIIDTYLKNEQTSKKIAL